MHIVPRPQHEQYSDERIHLDALDGIATDGSEPATASVDRVQTVIDREIDHTLPAVDSAGATGPTISLRTVDTIEPPAGQSIDIEDEAYRLSVTGDGIELVATTAAGFHYGAQTLAGLIEGADSGEAYTVTACEVVDWPAFEWRGVMVDPARKFIPLSDLYDLVESMARAKLNVLHLHLIDNEGYAMESTAYPELNRSPDGTERPCYSQEEMAAFVEHAGEWDITVIPELDAPGHGLHLLTQIPDIRCDTPGETTVFNLKPAFCLGKDRSYEVWGDLLDEVVSVFDADIVHVGADEWSHHGIEWEDCVDCRAYMESEGLDGVQELFYDFIHRAHEMVTARGRRMSMWSEQIDISERPVLPSDIMMHFWIVSYPPWGPAFEGNSFDLFAEEGYELLNSYPPATYLNTLDPERLLSWTPTTSPEVSEANVSGVPGGELCIWGDAIDDNDEMRAYHDRVMPSGVAVFADRVWNATPIDDRDAFSRAVTRHLLGPDIPAKFDVFAALGGVVLPTISDGYAKKAHFPGSALGRPAAEAIASYEETIETLESVGDDARFPAVVDEYVDALEWLVEVVERDSRGLTQPPDKV
ncbi:family 20 glycosylhydrolase [Haloarchaeobius sp. TZWSO28]|uniref:family 20 glycosylhydrolase n=1 Tax=Haloarchaeobius sp. TZWSO28 TaxID=3446119 RepID=UPI003EBBA2D8